MATLARSRGVLGPVVPGVEMRLLFAGGGPEAATVPTVVVVEEEDTEAVLWP